MTSKYEMNYTNRRNDHQHLKTLKNIKNTKTQTYQNREKLRERDYYHEQFEIHKNDLRNDRKSRSTQGQKTHNIPYK